MRRFAELQGLRGLLALWVFVSHIILFAWKPVSELPAPFNILMDGSHAVNGFIILSGFVITHLLNETTESYLRYIWRRFCRLYPLFVFSVVLAFAAVQFGYMPAAFSPGTAVTHLLLHLTLFHGAIPNDWLANAQGSLLAPTWSVSLEWQFYLIAPLAIAFAKRSPRATFFLSLFVFACHRCIALRLVPHYDYPGFLLLKLGYFWLGTSSWFLIRAWNLNPEWATRMAPYRFIFVVGLAVLGISVSSFLSLFIWLGVLAMILPDGLAVPSKPLRLARRVMTSAPLAWLGDISYAVYLLHEIVLCFVLALAGPLLGVAGPQRLLSLSVISLPITLVICVIAHHVIERPGIRLGHLSTTR